MRLPIVPAWFPLRALALQGVMALCVLLFCLAPLWYVTWKLEADIKGLETRIQVQETLQPLMEGLNARREETRRLLGATKTLPTPDTLPLIVKVFLYISHSDSSQIISLFFVHFAYFLRFVL